MKSLKETALDNKIKKFNKKTHELCRHGVALKRTRAEEFVGIGALHGPLLLKLQHSRSEDLLDLLRRVPPGLVVLGFCCAT